MPGNLLGFAGKEARGLIRDWAYNAKTGRYRIINDRSIHLDGKLSQLHKPVFAVTFDGDKLSPHRAMQNLLDKMSAAQKQHWRTSARDLKLDKLGHFDWVKQGQAIVPKVGEWVRKVRQHSLHQ